MDRKETEHESRLTHKHVRVTGGLAQEPEHHQKRKIQISGRGRSHRDAAILGGKMEKSHNKEMSWENLKGKKGQKSPSDQHLTIEVRLEVDKADGEVVGMKCPEVIPVHIPTVVDSGALANLVGWEITKQREPHGSDVSKVKIKVNASNGNGANVSRAGFSKVHSRKKRSPFPADKQDI